MTSGDPRERVLRALAGELHVGPLARRRILMELADHIDDAVDDLCDAGASREDAIEEAVRRLGDAETIANTFGVMRTQTVRWSRLRVRRSLAWMMVAAMSTVTALGVELPQASGAKPPARVSAAGPRATASSRLVLSDRAATRDRGRPSLAGTVRGRPGDRRSR